MNHSQQDFIETFANIGAKMWRWLDGREGRENGIIVIKILSKCFNHFGWKISSWLDDPKTHDKWIIMKKIVFQYFPHFGGKIWS